MTAAELKKKAKLVAKKIKEDLNDRQGFDTGGLPKDIQEEMKEAWMDIVMEVFADQAKTGG